MLICLTLNIAAKLVNMKTPLSAQHHEPTTKAKSKIRYHHGDLRNTLMGAALLLIDEKGPRGFSITEAARRAGVSIAAPYRHFADKEALLAAIALQGLERLMQDVFASVNSTLPIADIIPLAAQAYVRYARDHRAYFRAMFGAELDKSRFPELLTASQQGLQQAIDLLDYWRAHGGPNISDSATIASELWAMTHGVAALMLDGVFNHTIAHVQPEQLVDGLVRRYLQELLTRSLNDAPSSGIAP